MKYFIPQLRYALATIYWFIFRPVTSGSKVVITCGDEILMIRHIYEPNYWTFPGGGTEKGETPEQTAIREVKEELGIDLTEVKKTGEFFNRLEYKKDTIYCFHAEVRDKSVVPQKSEIDEVCWFRPDQLPGNIGARKARKILDLYLESKKVQTLNE